MFVNVGGVCLPVGRHLLGHLKCQKATCTNSFHVGEASDSCLPICNKFGEDVTSMFMIDIV